MRMPFIVCSLILATSVARAADDVVRFVPLRLSAPATTMALTEDGRYLIVAHEAEDRLSVWDVRNQRVTRSLTTRAPRHVLCRGDTVYVANYGAGTISRFSRRSWRLQPELQVGELGVYYLSAPGGSYFSGDILATCGRYTDHEIVWINSRTNTHKDIGGATYMSVATFSFNGKYVIKQGEVGHSPSATVDAFHWQMDENGGSLASFKRGDHRSTPILSQPHDGPLWFGGGSVLSGMPPRQSVGLKVARVIADMTRLAFYTMDNASIAAHPAAPGSKALATRPMVLPKRDDRSRRSTGRSYTFVSPIAATLGQSLYIFYMDVNSQVVCGARTSAFSGLPRLPAQGGGTSPETFLFEFPARVVQGVPIEVQLHDGPEGGAAPSVVRGPAGLTVTDAGKLTWTPAADQIGGHHVVISTELGGEKRTQPFFVEVVPPAADDEEDPLADIPNGVFTLPDTDYDIAPARSRRHQLLRRGARLDVLDIEGWTIRKTFLLPRLYAHVLDCGTACLGTRDGNVDVLDKATLAATLTSPLAGTLVGRSVPDACTPCYVAMLPAGGKGLPVVATLDPESGETTPVGCHGTAVVAAPGLLFTALAGELTPEQAGAWTFAGERPSPGPINAVCGYRVGDGGKAVPESVRFLDGLTPAQLRLAPGARRLLVLTVTGEDRRPARALMLEADGLDDAAIALPADAVVDASFHPQLPWLAWTDGSAVHVLDTTELGAAPELLDLGDAAAGSVRRAQFTPGGRHLLVDYRTGSRRVLKAVPLNLTNAQVRAIRQGLSLSVTAPGSRG